MVTPCFTSNKQPRIDELIGKQRTVFVRKHGFEPDGARVGVDLIVDRQKGAGSQSFLLLPIECVDRQLLPALSRSITAGRLSSGMVKTTVIGMS